MTKELNCALLVLEIMQKLEMRAVPESPTPKMTEAGMRAGKISKERLDKIYKAMLEAAADDIPRVIN